MSRKRQLTLIDKFIIGIQILIITYSIFINTLAVIANYFNTVSPLIPETVHWELSKDNLYLLVYWVIIALITLGFYRNYKRIKFILLLTGTLVAEHFLWTAIEKSI